MSDGRESAHEGLTGNSETEKLDSPPSGARGKAETNATMPVDPLVIKLIYRLIDVQRELDERKRFYEEYNKIVIQLVGLGFVSLDLGGVGRIELKDAYANGNTAWTSAAVQRFSIEVVSPELQAKRAKRAAKEAK